MSRTLAGYAHGVEDEAPSAAPWVPEGRSLARLRSAATACQGCELWHDTTQTVFSTGPRDAVLMLVGEQPGDVEDREGEVFVGPAGRILDQALERAGIERDSVYLTNAVKHFRHENRGKRRIHQKPAVAHIVACRPWLAAEVAIVRPDVVVAMGSVAARSVLGRPVKINDERGQWLGEEEASISPDVAVMVTTHPSAVLRLRGLDDPGLARRELNTLVRDLRRASRRT
ncbi:MAG TPA: UdgX family uracil-DNA binding protein [Aeromicrobium sp.]|nr:UdgX family uracil-DNA binding protein [Aeromicrobium sp.]